jgi:nitrous oxide reductase accessory protein NosL
LPLRSIRVAETPGPSTSITLDGRKHPHQVTRHADGVTFTLAEAVVVPAGGKLVAQL